MLNRTSRRLALLAAAASAALASAPVWAAEAADAGSATNVDQLVVTATRTEKKVDELPVTASVITSEQIDDRLATDIKDLIRYEPGVSVRTAPARFNAAGAGVGRDGNAGFNIRGLEGNRVLIMVDGIRVPDGFDFGAQNVGRGGYGDLGTIKSVEIVRGPASALYGSDGLAGAVSFFTKDPSDVLKGDRAFAAEARAGYSSADEGSFGNLLFAGSAGAFEGLISYTYREGSEQENQGSMGTPTPGLPRGAGPTRTAANPQSLQSNAILGKLVFRPAEGHALRFTYDHFDSEMDADVWSARTTTTLQVLAHDETDRDRYSLDYRYSGGEGLISEVLAAVYYQDSTTTQFTYEDRTAPDRTRLNTFDNEVWGASVQVNSRFQTGGVTHEIVWGGDWSETRQQQVRDGTVPTPPDVFPSRAFPNTDYRLAGLYVQDEIGLLDGRLMLYPALRYDWYELSPEDDALYTGPTPTGQSDSQLSPKLGVVWKFSESTELFGNLAMGFKAPAPSQVNTSFSNPLHGYTSISNPDLKPEKSKTAEIGLRWKSDRLYVQASVFTGEYEDFISREIVSYVPLMTYQFINFSDVEISGIEARARLKLDENWTLNAAIASTDGDVKTPTGSTPLASINPTQFASGLSWRASSGRFGADLSLVIAAAKDESDAGGSFAPPNFGVLDLTGFWNPTDNVTLRGGVFNLNDEKYWYWSDVRGIAPNSVEKDAYTMPGRNFGVSLTLKL